MSKESDEKRELLKLKQGIIEESEIIEVNKHKETEKPHGLKWLENFMYRNKWYVIVGVFFAAAAAFLTYQTLSREAADLTVLVVTSDITKTPTLYQKINALETAVEQYCPDFDNNGNVHVDMYYIDISKDGGDIMYINTNNAKFFGEIQRGEAQLFICDEGIFASFDEGREDADTFDEAFTDLYEVTGDPSLAGVKNIKLKDTVIAKEANWEKSCPDVLGLGLKQEKEGMISYSESALENNRKAKEVIINILNDNKINPKKEK